MWRSVAARVFAIVPVMLVVLLIVFSLIHLSGGDPAALMAGPNATSQQVAAIRAALHLNEPLPLQFVRYVKRVLTFDLGNSIYSNIPVATLIGQRVEPTFLLSTVTIVLSVMFAVPAGVFAAWQAGRALDRTLMFVSVFGFSIPIFVTGYALVQAFAITLGWLPVEGYKPLADGLFVCLRGLVLPSVALTLLFSALIARVTRATMMEVLSEDFIRTARAKGASERRVLIVHAIKNIGVPVATIVGTSFAALLGGVVVTESVFNIPGIGRLTVDAITTRDYPVVQGVMLVFAAVLVVVNLLVDLSYPFFDPRVNASDV